MKLRLGGKGYAPDRNCALGQHIKGLGEFVTLMQTMEEVIEEDQDIRWAAAWQNQQNDLCILCRLRSAWTSFQS